MDHERGTRLTTGEAHGEEANFASSVERWILDAERANDVHNFDELVCVLPGVYPTFVRTALTRLEATGRLDAATTRRLLQRAAEVPLGSPPASQLPVPHPLDFDWRFAASALDRLAAECVDRSGGAEAVLLGAPSVLSTLRDRQAIPALLLDANRAVVAAFSEVGSYRAVRCDFGRDTIPNVKSPVVILDPPWYVEHERLFLWAASCVCASGGAILVSLPAVGTRASVAQECETALEWARALGLVVESREPGALSYLSPPFERNALRVAGLDGLPSEWRRGDLVVLRSTGAPIRGAPPDSTTATPWPEVDFGRVRIRIRNSGAISEGEVIAPELEHVVSGDVLDDVSRRDPRRQKADVWTSGNRIFGCRSPEAARTIMKAMVDDSDPIEALAGAAHRPLTRFEQRRVRATICQITELVAVESRELDMMGWAA